MATARDGSPVELYALLPELGKAKMIHGAVAPGCEILELGCGTGRVTQALVELGHRVVVVDESAEMLARVPRGRPSSWCERGSRRSNSDGGSRRSCSRATS